MSQDGSLPPDPLNDPAFRDRRSLYLDDWATLVEPRNLQAAKMIAHSVTYGSGALQASYLLNGGALAALPTFFSVFTAAKPAEIAGAAFFFILSLIATAVSSTAAYLNFQWHAALAWHDADHVSAMLRRFYERSKVPDPPQSKRDRLLLGINISFFIGFGAALLALGLFVWGALEFRELAQRTTPLAGHISSANTTTP